MQAIIDLNGKQYQVEEGRYVKVDRLNLDENAELELDSVLMVINGEKSVVGAPTVSGAKVKAKVLSHGKDGKVLVYKMRCKKGYRRKAGHRQGFTNLQIVEFDFPGIEKVAPAKKADDNKAEKKTASKTTKAAAPKKVAQPEVAPAVEENSSEA